MTTETARTTRSRSPKPSRAGSTHRRRQPRWLTHVLLLAFGLVMLYPILWMLSSSFKETGDIFSEISLIPNPLVLDNYSRGWAGSGIPFGRFFINSTIVAVGSVVGNLAACSLAAYAFARLDFRFRRVLFALMLATIMLPYHVVIIPQYILFSQLGWVNTFLPLVVPKFLAVDAFFIFLMVQFIRGLPVDLDQAARIDGAGPWKVYWYIVLPLTTPGLVTTAIFTFIWTWNDFFTPLIYLNDPNLHTVPLALNAFLDATGNSAWGAMFAMSILSLGPLFGFFLAGQRYLTEGIATTGLK